MKFFRSLVSVSTNTLVSRILGFIRDRITYSYLGAGEVSDALSVATKAPALFRRLFAEGAFNAAFVPIFSGLYNDESVEKARQFASQAFMYLAGFLLAFVLVVELIMPLFISVIAPGFAAKANSLKYAIDFTRITFPFIFFISLTALLGGVLNSMHSFGPPAATQIISNLVLITVFYFLHPFFKVPGYAAAIGSLVSGLAQFLWLYWVCLRKGFYLTFSWPRITPEITSFFRLFLPGVLGAGVVQLNLFVNMMIGSYLPKGQLTLLNIADRVNQLPLSIVGVALGTVLLPLLHAQLRRGEQEALHTQNKAIELAWALTMPAVVMLLAYGDIMIGLLFVADKFTWAEVSETTPALIAFTTGLPAYVLIKVASSNFFARKDTTTPMYVGAFSFFINAVLSGVSVYYLNEQRLAHIGIAFSLSVSSWINVLLLFSIAWWRKLFVPDISLFFFLVKSTLAATGTYAAVRLASLTWHTKVYHAPALVNLKGFAIIGLVATLVYVALAYILGVLKLQDIKINLTKDNK